MENTEFYFEGPSGRLSINPEDKPALRLAMLIEGQHKGKTIDDVAAKYGISRTHYYKVLDRYKAEGVAGLVDKKRGPQENHVRTETVTNQILRHRFLDSNASPAVIAQKLNQTGIKISGKSVERTIKEYGLEKKTL
jgi:transposase